MLTRLSVTVLIVLVLLTTQAALAAQEAARGRNVRGIHTLAASRTAIDDQLAWARSLVGAGGYVTQPFLGIEGATAGPSPDAVYFVEQAYARELTPILVLQGRFVNRDGCNASGYVGWLKPTPDADGGYRAEAEGYRRFVAGLPLAERRTLYVQIGNEPNLNEMWGGAADPSAYARFLADVSAAIRTLGDGRIRLLNAALAPEGDVDNLQFIAEAARAEPRFGDAFDDWASHPYPRNQPPANNLHDGTAQPGSRYTIDAYLLELAALAESGIDTRDLQVVLSETGYELGDSHYPVYPTISEDTRAEYVRLALDEYWPRWPEVRAVTPFALAGWYGSWKTFDWVWPSSTTTAHGLPTQPHLQYARLVPGLGFVQGSVRDDAGTSLGNVAIVAEPGGYRATSLPDGTFLLLAPPGEYTLLAQRDGYDQAVRGGVYTGQRMGSSLALTLPARLSTVLRNAGFEQGDLAGWTPWGDVDGVQARPWFFDVGATEGSRFLGTAVNCGAKDGGVQQTIAARPGTTIAARARTLTLRDGAATIRNRLGIDPSGGSEPRADRVVWSPWVETDGRWGNVSVFARAQADRVTIFLEHDQDAANPWNVSAFDNVELVAVP